MAATFAGNVPYFDILAADLSGRTFPVQVKAIQSASWQFDIRTFLDIELLGNTQVVKGKKMAKININRVPVLTRWAAIVAERLGYKKMNP